MTNTSLYHREGGRSGIPPTHCQPRNCRREIQQRTDKGGRSTTNEIDSLDSRGTPHVRHSTQHRAGVHNPVAQPPGGVGECKCGRPRRSYGLCLKSAREVAGIIRHLEEDDVGFLNPIIGVAWLSTSRVLSKEVENSRKRRGEGMTQDAKHIAAEVDRVHDAMNKLGRTCPLFGEISYFGFTRTTHSRMNYLAYQQPRSLVTSKMLCDMET